MKDIYTGKWILENSLNIISEYEKEVLTIRGLHYRLVGLGMINDILHYNRVKVIMVKARWDGIIPFDTFSDHDRYMIGKTEYEIQTLEEKIEQAQTQVQLWMKSYSRNIWEGQKYYPEVLIEKKALQGVFEPVCKDWNIALGACKGYPSLTFLNDMYKRFLLASQENKTPVILYFGDYDPSGEDIPRSIEDNILRISHGCFYFEIQRIALNINQVKEMKLPPAPIKAGDSRSKNWDGIGQVELDAIDPKILKKLANDAIENIFDNEVGKQISEQVEKEKIIFHQVLKEFATTL